MYITCTYIINGYFNEWIFKSKLTNEYLLNNERNKHKIFQKCENCKIACYSIKIYWNDVLIKFWYDDNILIIIFVINGYLIWKIPIF